MVSGAGGVLPLTTATAPLSLSRATVLTAGGDRVGCCGIRPQLAPDPPPLRAGRRQETLLLDDGDVDAFPPGRTLALR